MMKSIYNRLSKLYNVYFLNDIKKLIKNYNCSYKFLSITDYAFLNHSGLPYKSFTYNEYLKESQNDKTLLAKDILKNGMFFPFFGYIKDGQFYIILGKHRLYSLLLQYKKQPFNNKFLFIIFPSDFLRKSKKHEQKQTMYKYDGQILTELFIVEDKELVTVVDKFGFFLSNEIFQFNKEHKEQIKPSLILNDEELFKQFLEQ